MNFHVPNDSTCPSDIKCCATRELSQNKIKNELSDAFALVYSGLYGHTVPDVLIALFEIQK